MPHDLPFHCCTKALVGMEEEEVFGQQKISLIVSNRGPLTPVVGSSGTV